MKLKVGKFYRTRYGRKVRLYALDACGDYPVHGALLCNDGSWILASWTCGGHDDAEGPASCDDIVSEWTEEPEIHWGRIPDGINKICIRPTQGIIDASTGCVVFGATGDDWAFPNWRDFIGQTFERPKA